jgi:membrane-bound lytic murein transglycosylase MltF
VIVRRAAFILFGMIVPLAANAQASTATKAMVATLSRAAVKREQMRSRDEYDAIFRKNTKRYFGPAFDWNHFKAQGMAESELNPNARSRVGARGIMQLMPGTFNLIFPPRQGERSIDDPNWNIAAAVMHDRYLWSRWQKDNAAERLRFMFASYNAGEGPILRALAAARAAQLNDGHWSSIEQVAPGVGGWRYRETLGYVKKIGSNYGELTTRGNSFLQK